MNKYQYYPITKIPEKIIEAKNAVIPQIQVSEKPKKPIMKKKRYFGFIFMLVSIGIAAYYRFADIEETSVYSFITTTLLIVSVTWFVYEVVTNKLKSLTNSRALKKYNEKYKAYKEDLRKYKEIEEQNKDPFVLSQYRKEQLKTTLLISKRNLKPHTLDRSDAYKKFYAVLVSYFGDNVLINYTVEQNSDKEVMFPEFIVIEPKSRLHIDIEIDIPYDMENRKILDYYDNGYAPLFIKSHDRFFNESGWLVIRFSEEQIVKYPDSCCKFIAQQFFEITDVDTHLAKFNTIKEVPRLKVWSKIKAGLMEKDNYREKYLFPEKLEKPIIKKEDKKKEIKLEKNNETLQVSKKKIDDKELKNDKKIDKNKNTENNNIKTVKKSEKKSDFKLEKNAIIDKKENKLLNNDNLKKTNETNDKPDKKTADDVDLIETKKENSKLNKNNTNKNTEDKINTENKKDIIENESKLSDLDNNDNSNKIVHKIFDVKNDKNEKKEINKDEIIKDNHKKNKNDTIENDDNKLIKNEREKDSDKDTEPEKSEREDEGKISIDNLLNKESQIKKARIEKEKEETQTKEKNRTSEKDIQTEETINIDTDRHISIDKKSELNDNEKSVKIYHLINKMKASYRLDEWEKLLKITTEIIELEPKYEIAYLRRSTAKGNLNDFEGALKDCETIISINSYNPDAYYNAGLSCYFLKEYDKALAYFEKAIKLNVSNIEKVYFSIANIYAIKSELVKEIDNLEHAAKLGHKKAQERLFKIKRKESQNSRDFTKGYIIRNLETDNSGAYDIEFSYNDEYIAVSGLNSFLKIYRLKSWDLLEEIKSSSVSVSFSKDNKLMAIGGPNFLQLRRVKDHNFSNIENFIETQINIKQIFFDMDDKNILATDNFAVYNYNIETTEFSMSVSDFQLFCISKERMYYGGVDYFKNINIYKTTDNSLVSSFSFDKATLIQAMAINSGSNKVAIGDSIGNIYIYHLKSGTLLKKIEAFKNKNIKSIYFDPDGKYLLATEEGKETGFWELASGSLMRKIKTKLKPEFSVLSNLGFYLALGGYSDKIEIWHIKKEDFKTDISVANHISD